MTLWELGWDKSKYQDKYQITNLPKMISFYLLKVPPPHPQLAMPTPPPPPHPQTHSFQNISPVLSKHFTVMGKTFDHGENQSIFYMQTVAFSKLDSSCTRTQTSNRPSGSSISTLSHAAMKVLLRLPEWGQNISGVQLTFTCSCKLILQGEWI